MLSGATVYRGDTWGPGAELHGDAGGAGGAPGMAVDGAGQATGLVLTFPSRYSPAALPLLPPGPYPLISRCPPQHIYFGASFFRLPACLNLAAPPLLPRSAPSSPVQAAGGCRPRRPRDPRDAQHALPGWGDGGGHVPGGQGEGAWGDQILAKRGRGGRGGSMGLGGRGR